MPFLLSCLVLNLTQSPVYRQACLFCSVLSCFYLEQLEFQECSSGIEVISATLMLVQLGHLTAGMVGSFCFCFCFYLSFHSSFDHHSQKQNQLGIIYIYRNNTEFGVLQNNLTTLLKWFRVKYVGMHLVLVLGIQCGHELEVRPFLEVWNLKGSKSETWGPWHDATSRNPTWLRANSQSRGVRMLCIASSVCKTCRNRFS